MKRSLDGNCENQSKKGVVEMIRGEGASKRSPSRASPCDHLLEAYTPGGIIVARSI